MYIQPKQSLVLPHISMKLMMADGCIIDDEDAFQLLQDQINEIYCIKEGENLCIPGTSHVSESFSSTGNHSS